MCILQGSIQSIIFKMNSNTNKTYRSSLYCEHTLIIPNVIMTLHLDIYSVNISLILMKYNGMVINYASIRSKIGFMEI